MMNDQLLYDTCKALAIIPPSFPPPPPPSAPAAASSSVGGGGWHRRGCLSFQLNLTTIIIDTNLPPTATPTTTTTAAGVAAQDQITLMAVHHQFVDDYGSLVPIFNMDHDDKGGRWIIITTSTPATKQICYQVKLGIPATPTVDTLRLPLLAYVHHCIRRYQQRSPILNGVARNESMSKPFQSQHHSHALLHTRNNFNRRCYVCQAPASSSWHCAGCSFDLCHGCKTKDTGATEPASQEGDTELIKAARSGVTEKVARLLKNLKIGTIDDTNQVGNTALLVAAAHGHTAICEMLIEAKANVNYVNLDGDTPLSLAIAKKFDSTAMSLLRRGANPNHVDKYGDTPLLDAAMNGYVDLVKTMIAQYSGNKRIVNAFGDNAFLRAQLHGHQALAEFLSDEAATRLVWQHVHRLGTLSANNTTVATSSGPAGDEMPTFIADRKFTSGIHNWTVKCEFTQGRFASIGVALVDGGARTSVGLGWRGRTATLSAGQGWALDVGDGQKVSHTLPGAGTGAYSSPLVSQGQTSFSIDVRLDMDQGTMEYVHGGKSLGVAFTNIKGTVSPAVCYDGSTRGSSTLANYQCIKK